MRRLPLRLTLRTVTVSVLSLALLGLAGPVPAAPTWLPATGLRSAVQRLFDVDLNARGDAVAVGMTPGTPGSVLVSTRAPAGGWSAPQAISAVGQSSGQPDVAIGADGTAVAVWLVANGANQQVVASVRPPGGAWSGSELVSGAATTTVEPQVGIDAAGTALVVFSDGTRIQATSRPAGGAWSMPTGISGQGTARHPRLSVADSGHAVAAWEHTGDGTNHTVSASVRAPGGAWVPPNPLTAPYASGGAWPATSINNHGDAAVEYVRPVGGVPTVHAVVRRGGAWTAAQAVSTPGIPADADSVAIGDDGTVVVPFLQDQAGQYFPLAAARRPDGVWDAPQTLSTAPATEFPRAGVDTSGNATVAWGGTAGGVAAVMTSRRSAGAAWSAAEVRSAPGTASVEAHLAQNASGDALVGWTATAAGGAPYAHVAVLDSAGPAISKLTIPASGAVGIASDFSAVVSDAWADVTAVSWNFSDGAAGTGATPSHVWSTPGIHAVTLTATDAFGNVTTRSGQVEVVGTVDVTRFKLKPHVLKLRGTRKQTRVKAKVTLSSAAKVTLTFTPKKARKGKKKKVYAILTRNLRGGTSTLTITAKVGGKKLKPGAYKVVVWAKTAAGKGRSRKTTLKVVR